MLSCLREHPGGWFHADASFRQTEVLSCSKLPDCRLANQTEGGLLLDMTGVKCNLRYLEARILRYFYRIQFSGIEPSLNSFQGASDRLIDSGCYHPADTGVRTGIRKPHKVPARSPDLLIQNGGCRILDRHPRFTELCWCQIKSIG